ncbi:MAG: DUF6134 family protein [Paracoccaceae bacterium]
MKRRVFLAGCAATGLYTPALAASSASRTFSVARGGDPMGEHVLSAVRNGDRFEIDIVIRLKVKILGVTAYRYEMDNREVWQNGRLVSLNTKVNDDGTKDFATAKQAGEQLDIKGSRFSGLVAGDAVTTTYYAKQFIERRPWISTQSGAPLDIAIKPEGRGNWWQVTGELETRLGYDARGEWTGCEFDAGGEPGVYEVTKDAGAISALWLEA